MSRKLFVNYHLFYAIINVVLSIEFYRSTNAFSYQGYGTLSKIRNQNQGSFKTLRATEIDKETTIGTNFEQENEDDEERDELVDAITAKLNEMEGLWYSDDFYGPHGREWVKVSATLVGETATSALVATKVTGDPNVPAGCVTFRTKSWPIIGEKVSAEIQVRANPKDPNGFTWLSGDLTLVAKDTIRLMCRYNSLMSSEGMFYREKENEEGGES